MKNSILGGQCLIFINYIFKINYEIFYFYFYTNANIVALIVINHSNKENSSDFEITQLYIAHDIVLLREGRI